MTVNNYADIFCNNNKDVPKEELADLQIENKLVENEEIKENIYEPKKNVN